MFSAERYPLSKEEEKSPMRTRQLNKFVRRVVGMSHLAGGMGVIGGLGVGVATSCTAGAVTATYKCQTPIGT